MYFTDSFALFLYRIPLTGKGELPDATQVITHADFRIPTTAAGFGDAIYVINARFDVAPPPFFGGRSDPTLEYELVRVEVHD
ncbi:MAG: hypothetical protein OEZ43_11835 [Gammaproteobacteria bacterium]|nr:hypothetical protein [Gammaproteobacteria bacterium]